MQFQSVERLVLILFSDSKSMNWEIAISLERKASRKLFCRRKGELTVRQFALYWVSGFCVLSI